MKAAVEFSGHRVLRTGLDAVFECGLGRVWAPCVPTPRAFLAQAAFYYVGGDSGSPGAKLILDAIPPATLTIAPDAAWRSAMRCAWSLRLGRTRLLSFTQYGGVDGGAGTSPKKLPAGYRLAPVDRSVVRSVVRAFGRDFLGPHRSVRQFLTAGGGWAIVHRRQAVSAAAVMLCTGRAAEFSVATSLVYRSRGFATAVCRALLGTVQARGLAPEWTAASAESAHLARHLGFTAPRPVWGFWKLF
jgi:hypothetical protein